MYTVIVDGNVLYDARFDDYQILDAKVQLEVNKSGSFEFSVYPTNPTYDNIQKLKSHIKVYQDGVLIFGGRVLNDVVRFDKRKDVYCEGYLAYFNDSIVRPYTFNGTITEYLQLIVNEHNAQVGIDKQFTIGDVTVTDPNDYIVRSNITHTKSWIELKAKLLDTLGGFLIVRVENDIKYLDYLEDSIYMSTQKIELGKNLLDTIQETRSDDIITALIPLGAKLQDENGNDTDERLTIESVNGGIDYISDVSAVAEYGYIFDTVIFDDVTVASNLLTKANQELAIRVNLGVSVSLKAIDLSMIADVDEIRVFDYVQVTSEPHDIDTMALITKMEIDLLNPSNNTLQFGFNYETFTEKQVKADNVLKQIKSDYVTNDKVQAVNNELVTLTSQLLQTADSIIQQVAENYVTTGQLGSVESGLINQIVTNANETLQTFTEFEQTIELVDGKYVTKFNELETYVRTSIDGLELGETNSPFKLKISKNRISFLENNNEVAYISNSTLNITDGAFFTSLRIGNFEWKAEDDGGLSLVKVV